MKKFKNKFLLVLKGRRVIKRKEQKENSEMTAHLLYLPLVKAVMHNFQPSSDRLRSSKYDRSYTNIKKKKQ